MRGVYACGVLSLIASSGVAQLIVRNIEDEVVHRLKVRAATHGVSMEEEHRRLLRKALLDGVSGTKKSFPEMLLSIPKGAGDEPDNLFDRQKDFPRSVEL